MKTLADHMEDVGINDAALAQRVNCGRSMITKIRNRRATPSLPLALAIVRATGVEIHALVPPATHNSPDTLSAPLSSSPGGAEPAPGGPPAPSGAEQVTAPDQTESEAPACPANSARQNLRATMPPTGVPRSRFATADRSHLPGGTATAATREVRT